MDVLKKFKSFHLLVFALLALTLTPGIYAGIPSAFGIHQDTAVSHAVLHAHHAGVFGHHSSYGDHLGGVVAHPVGGHGHHGSLHQSFESVIPHVTVHSAHQAGRHTAGHQGIGLHTSGHGGHNHARITLHPRVIHGHSHVHHGVSAHHGHQGIGALHASAHAKPPLTIHHSPTITFNDHHAPIRHHPVHTATHHGVGYQHG